MSWTDAHRTAYSFVAVAFTDFVMRLSTVYIRKMSTTVRSTAASGSQVYDTTRAVNEYLLFHYGGYTNATKQLQMPYMFGPLEALNFPTRTATLCNVHATNKGSDTRALDVGCSVGGSSFELSQHFEEVVGIDFSQHFINAANEMKSTKKQSFEILKQGKIFEPCSVELPVHLLATSHKVTFLQGDACNLSPSLGMNVKYDASYHLIYAY